MALKSFNIFRDMALNALVSASSASSTVYNYIFSPWLFTYYDQSLAFYKYMAFEMNPVLDSISCVMIKAMKSNVFF